MLTVTRSSEVRSIVRQLATLPGSIALAITYKWLNVARDLPRHETTRRSFRTDSIPDLIAIADDAEDLVISLQGALPQWHAVEDLLKKLSDWLAESGMGQGWNARIKAIHWQQDQYRYELIVCTPVLRPPAPTPVLASL